jgi:hypothetical protein
VLETVSENELIKARYDAGILKNDCRVDKETGLTYGNKEEYIKTNTKGN